MAVVDRLVGMFIQGRTDQGKQDDDADDDRTDQSALVFGEVAPYIFPVGSGLIGLIDQLFAFRMGKFKIIIMKFVILNFAHFNPPWKRGYADR